MHALHIQKLPNLPFHLMNPLFPTIVRCSKRRTMTTYFGQNENSWRELHCRDAISWLEEFENDGILEGSHCFTSLPDISELSRFSGPTRVNDYKSWFSSTVSLLLSKMPKHSYTIFLQSDVRVLDDDGNVAGWIDKSQLCSNAAALSGCRLIWHKIVVLHKENTKRSVSRPTFSHFVCYYKADPSTENKTYHSAKFAIPDVFYRGEMLWPKAIGLDCCFAGVSFLKHIAHATCIIDQFAGQGTVLSMANYFGINSIGVEISAKRCKRAKHLQMNDKMHLISSYLHTIELPIMKEREKVVGKEKEDESELEGKVAASIEVDDDEEEEEDKV